MKKAKPVSVKLIHEIGGQKINYNCMEVADSFECYQVLRQNLITNLQKEDKQLMFFEDRMTTDCNINVCMVKNVNGKKEQAVFRALFLMTLLTDPNVGYCRLFDFPGILSFKIIVIISLFVW